ncbi:hypothetical protein [Lysobacter firmicutimachus]|uniref:DUF2974 domain-containing protein n=1 Tax=Lysobacter firmicutimachus TaxID=1792846 RepID=A0ABU8D5R3_9GAMM
MSFVSDIAGTVTRVVEPLLQREPPPPPPALTAEQIQARADAATSDPQQRELLVQGYTQAQQDQDGALWQQTELLQTLYHDREVLTLSRSLGADDTVPEGWHRASDAELAQYGLSAAQLHPQGSGFNAQLFIPDPAVFGPDAAPVLQFEGTDFGDLEDVNADVAQAIGNDEAYYNQAIDIASSVAEHGGDEVIFSGHSLGGGLATAAALVTGNRGVVSNPAGVHPATVEAALAERGLRFEQADGNITTYAVDGDLLTELQAATSGLSADNADGFAAILNGVGLAVNRFQDEVRLPTDATAEGVLNLPDAVGRRVTLDATDAEGNPREGIVSLEDTIDGINAASDRLPIGELGDVAKTVGDGGGLFGDIGGGFGDLIDSGTEFIDEHLPGPAGDIVGVFGDGVETLGDGIESLGDLVEQGGDVAADATDAIETGVATAIEAGLEPDTIPSVLEMVDRHSFGVFDDSMASHIGGQEAALRERLDS